MHKLGVATLLFLLAALGAAASLIGTWNVVDPQSPMGPGAKFTMQFIKGSKVKMVIKTPKMTMLIDGNYNLKGEILTIKMTSQTVNGRRQAAPTSVPGVFKLKWKNKNMLDLFDTNAPKKMPALLTRVK